MPGVKRDFYNVCPVCWSVRIKHRVFKSPRYKCEKCGSEFPNKKRISYEQRILFNELLKGTKTNAEGLKSFSDGKLRKITVKTLKEHFKLCVK